MGLKQGDILVYTVIKGYKNAKTGLCNPGMDKELVPKTNLPKKSILNSINRLEQAGIITVIRKRGTSNQYTFKEMGDEFDMFAKKFLGLTDLTPHAKEFYMKIQEYLYVHEDGTGDTTYNVSELADLADVDKRSAKKYLAELQEKEYMFPEKTNVTDESGLATTRFVFDLQKLGQVILYKLKEHEENIQDLYQRDAEKDKKIVSMEREIEQLKRQLR